MGLLYPVAFGREEGCPEVSRARRVCEERFHEPVAFDDTERSGLPQFAEQDI